MNKAIRIVLLLLIVGAAAVVTLKHWPSRPGAVPAPAPDNNENSVNQRASRDQRRADRIVISDVKLAAGGVVLAQATAAVLSETLQLNGILRANQETVVQVTPRFPGIVRDIRKRIGDTVAKGDQLASVESNQSLMPYDLKAPISGTVIDRQISLGEYASEQKPAFVVADLSTIWVDLSVYRQEIKRVRLGDEVLIDPGDGHGEMRANISYVAPVGSNDTQTVLARVVLANEGGRLRPGLFVAARLVLARRGVPVAVRIGAIQTLDNKTVVFVREGDTIEARPVEIGESDARSAEIRAGLSAGERYVAENSFVVKAEMGKGEAND